MINLAFFTKALTAYVFFFTTLAVTIYAFGSWRFFLKPLQLFLLPLAFVAPYFWTSMHGSGAEATSAGLIHDIAMRFSTINPIQYLKHLLIFPLEFMARMAPVSLLLGYVIWKQGAKAQHRYLKLIGFILVINYLPYWLAPFSNMRHVVPLYAWASLALTWLLLQYDFQVRRMAVVAIAVILLLKVPFSLWGLPYLKERDETQAFRPISADILQRAGDTPIRQSSVSFVGFAVTAYINQMRTLKHENIHFLTGSDHRVYVIANEPLPNTKLIKTYSAFNCPVYLLYLP